MHTFCLNVHALTGGTTPNMLSPAKNPSHNVGKCALIRFVRCKAINRTKFYI